MTTAPLNIDTKRLPPTPQWSPILSHSQLHSPSKTSSIDEDLSLRCRKLARSFGESAIFDDFEPSSPRSRENSNENERGGGGPPSPLSPGRRHSHLPLSPPTPEGSHVLNEILEEGESETMSTGGAEIGRGEAENEKGLGFEAGGEAEPTQFIMSPPTGNPMSLHGASLAMEELGEKEGLGLSLHEQFKMDTDYYPDGEDDTYEKALTEQLKRGQSFIKVDLSLVDGELLIGNPGTQLDPSKTFSTCFVDPLVKILSEAAPSSPSPLFSFPSHHRRLSTPSPSPPPPSSSQTYLPNSSKPLYLEIILHSTPAAPPSLMLQYLQSSLQPLHDPHFLTSYCPNAKLSTKAPIVILVSSSAAGFTDEVMEQNLESPRIVYREITLNEAFSTATEGISSQSHPIISQDFGQLGGDFDEESKRILETKVKEAHEKGFLVKIEGVPKFPEHTRKSIEKNLKSIGIDYVV
ncbi:hypothetical protein JCM5350_005992 [Sporobolomyces pararoseus]